MVGLKTLGAGQMMYDAAALKQCTKCGQSYPCTPEHFDQVRAGQVRPSCRDCERAKKREYGRNNDRSLRDAKRRKLESGFRASDHDKRSMHARQNSMCILCAKPLPSIQGCSVDHKTPLTRGGSNRSSNLHLVHRLCNTDKKEKTVWEHWEWRVQSGFDTELIGLQLGIKPGHGTLGDPLKETDPTAEGLQK
jgi:hypothetical protein